MIDQKIKDLVYQIEQGPPENINYHLNHLIQHLHHTFSSHTPPSTTPKTTPYPIGPDGYAHAFDPLEDTEAFLDAFHSYGIVVGKNVIPQNLCRKAVQRLKDVAHTLSGGTFDFDTPATWHNIPKDKNSTPLISRGFFELYHDAIWSEIRQSVRLYIHHALLWQRADLWSSFDRFGVKLPNADGKALGLHVDQNPNIHPHFKTMQGILALADNPAEQGTFRGVAGSKEHFYAYAPMAKNQGEYVALEEGSALERKLSPNAQAFPLKAGNIVTWDSRTTHANTSNLSNSVRYVAMVSAGPVPQNKSEMMAHRLDALNSGLGSNVREALMHASMKPRFTNSPLMQNLKQPESLTLLGDHLYGLKPYAL